jgi:membrane protein implicated in regulation of membrane protease activity
MKPVTIGATILLAVVSLAHLMRILFGVRVTVADADIPMWVSGVAFVVAGGLAIMLWRGARTRG